MPNPISFVLDFICMILLSYVARHVPATVFELRRAVYRPTSTAPQPYQLLSTSLQSSPRATRLGSPAQYASLPRALKRRPDWCPDTLRGSIPGETGVSRSST